MVLIFHNDQWRGIKILRKKWLKQLMKNCFLENLCQSPVTSGKLVLLEDLRLTIKHEELMEKD